MASLVSLLSVLSRGAYQYFESPMHVVGIKNACLKKTQLELSSYLMQTNGTIVVLCSFNMKLKSVYKQIHTNSNQNLDLIMHNYLPVNMSYPLGQGLNFVSENFRRSIYYLIDIKGIMSEKSLWDLCFQFCLSITTVAFITYYLVFLAKSSTCGVRI